MGEGKVPQDQTSDHFKVSINNSHIMDLGHQILT